MENSTLEEKAIYTYYISSGARNKLYTLRLNSYYPDSPRKREYDRFVKNLGLNLEESKIRAQEYIKKAILKAKSESIFFEFEDTPILGEIVRGKKSIHTNTSIDKKIRYIKSGEIPFGKYIGEQFIDIMVRDRAYLEWLLDTSKKLDTEVNRTIVEVLTALFDNPNKSVKIEGEKKPEYVSRPSKFMGAIGQTIEVRNALLVSIVKMKPNSFGVSSDLLKFILDNGNIVTSFYSGKTLFEKNKRYNLKGTVKEHKEYLGNKQTQLTRIKEI